MLLLGNVCIREEFPEVCLGFRVESSSSSGSNDGVYWVLLSADMGSSVGGGMAICLDPFLGGMSN